MQIGFGRARARACLAAFAVAFFTHPLSATAQTATPAPPLDAVHAEAFADGAVKAAMLKDHIAGVTVAIIKGHDILLTKGYGLAAPGRAADADTLFRVGSISKTGTWIALMQLVEQGKINLDDPINAHLPKDLQIPDEGFKEPIRIRNLMAHNAGFEDAVFGVLFVYDPNKLLSQDAFLVRYRPHRVRPAGELGVYSNYGAGLAGSIVAHESGEDWPSYAEAHILRPLGMTTATYRDPYSPALAKTRGLAAPMPPEIAQHVTQGWKYENGHLVKQPYELVSQVASAGALSMSAKDAAHYMLALLNPELLEQAGVLKQSTFATMNQPLPGNYPGLESSHHGLLMYDLGGGRTAFGHDGGLVSHISRLEVSPELGAGVFVSINTQGEAGAFPGNFSRAFFDEFFPLAKQPATPVPADAKAMAQRFAGNYRALRRPYYRTEAAFESLVVANVTPQPDGDLLVGSLVGPSARLHPIGGNIYASASSGSKVAFAEKNGRMMMYDDDSVAPSERVGYFEGLNWFFLIVFLGLFTAAWGTASGIRRIVLGTETQAAFLLDGVCLLWLVALVLLLSTLASLLSDTATIFTDYPNVRIIAACWLMLLAAIATPLVPLAVVFFARPRDWSLWRWARVAVAFGVLAALALTLWQHGFLGFSDWA